MVRGWVGGRGRSAYNLRLPTEGLRQGHGLRGRRPDFYSTRMYIFKRLRATAGQGPNYVGPSCGYVGLCWRTLAYLAGTAKKQCKMQEILMVGGLSWGYVGPPWGYVALS